MKMLRYLVTTGICLVLLGTGMAVQAEISVRTDPDGNYVATQILTTGSRGDAVVWGLHHRASRNFHILNPRGDASGDLWPVITEADIAPHHPWVVWSRFNGSDFDLVWSRWTAEGWRAVQGVECEPVAGNDLDPELTVDSMGRPYLVWSREENGVSSVHFSAFLLRQWMPGFQISEPGVDSRYPTIVEQFRDAIQVEFDTPDGKVRKWVMFWRPLTITDDINPLNHVHVKSNPHFVSD